MTLYYGFIPFMIMNIVNLYIMETPRFLVNKDNKGVVNILNTIAIRNNRTHVHLKLN